MLFEQMIILEDWTEVYAANIVDDKVKTMDEKLARRMDLAYPWVNHKMKATNPPWKTPSILKAITQRKEVYKTDEGRLGH